MKSPSVKCITTNNGRTRFNPNIYSEGKVCLSILGTWRGNPGEEWSSAQSLESVLISIQSLMSSNPYENEPGYETAKKEEPMPTAYVAKIRHETLRISVIQRLEGLLQIQPAKSEHISKKLKGNGSKPIPVDPPYSPQSHNSSTDGSVTPKTDASVYEYDAEAALQAVDCGQWEPFADLVKRRFLWYFDAYMRAVEKYGSEQSDGTAFKRMEFEYPPNSMDGHFDYKGLAARLETIFKKLQDEKQIWEKQGAQQVSQGTQLATQLAFQFRQLKYQWNEGQYSGSKLEISLPDEKNPFVWHITIFGEPMSNLDGGIFNMTLHIPPTFPEAQPRVTLETPIHHHRVSSRGTLCYFPQKTDEIGSHLSAIVAAIDDKQAKYDPRAMMNPEIFDMYWNADTRKTYNRKLRRSAQESSEFC